MLDDDVRYLRTPLGRIAAQIFGDGPVDVLVRKPPWYPPVDLLREDPRLVRFLERLSSFCRHVWFDDRGMGASDPIPRDEGRLHEHFVADWLAVLDALAIERAVLIDLSGIVGTLFAATHPERSTALVVIDPAARGRRALDFRTNVEDMWGTTTMARILAPSAGDDPAFLAWLSRVMRLSCSPSDAKWLFHAVAETDLLHVLPAVRVPTLVISHPASERGEASGYVAEHIEGARYVEVPGADALAFTDAPEPLLDAIEEFVTGRLPSPVVDRVLATILFTDVVGSTETAADLGDRRWRELLATHHDVVRAEIERHRGNEIKTMGDGFLVTFDGPGRAIRAAAAMRDAVRTLGVEMRAGLHTGEIELIGADVGGIAVHIAQRVQAAAEPGELLVSRTVVDLVAGSEIAFSDRGLHQLKGVPGDWQLFAVTDA
jgi:class 3 adenylate cyclase